MVFTHANQASNSESALSERETLKISSQIGEKSRKFGIQKIKVYVYIKWEDEWDLNNDACHSIWLLA